MVIVHVGSLFLQVERERSARRYEEKLIAELTKQVQQGITCYLEAALEDEVTELLDQGWYKRRRDQEQCWIETTCGKCSI
jgi:hypothetical protein